MQDARNEAFGVSMVIEQLNELKKFALRNLRVTFLYDYNNVSYQVMQEKVLLQSERQVELFRQ